MQDDSVHGTPDNGAENAAQKKKPFYKKWWFWVIIAIVAIALIGGIAGGTSGNSNSDVVKSAPNNVVDGNQSETDNTDKNEGSTSAEEFGIGDTVSNKAGIAFKVESVTNSDVAGEDYLTESTDANFIIIRLIVTNNGNEEYPANPYDFRLQKGSNEYTHHSSTYYYENGMSSLNGINPGITKTCIIVFETPSASTEEEYSLVCKGDAWFAADDVVIKLK